MILLRPEQHGAATLLFASLRHQLVVESVLDRHTLGRVYVDDPAAPRVGVLWTLMDAVLLAGTLDEATLPALRALILEKMAADARSRHVPHFTYTVSDPAWVDRLPALSPGRRLEAVPRRAFRLARRAVDWRDRLPAGMRLARLDEAFLARRDLAHMGALLGWVGSFWPDEGTFVERGLGFAVVDGEAVASWALSVYAGEGALELGVETVPAYRGRGLATVSADACLEACLAGGITPHWQCDVANTPSLRLAARLGFVPAGEYADYRLDIR